MKIDIDIAPKILPNFESTVFSSSNSLPSSALAAIIVI